MLASGLRQRYPRLNIEYGFLEYSSPNIHMALNRLVEKGINLIYVVPGMLFAATHAKNDIPSVLMTYQHKHPDLTIKYGRELGIHHNMIKAFQGRILEALERADIPPVGALYDTLLVVVGRGTSVAMANAEVAKMTRLVSENMGFGWHETVYSGVTFPSVGAGLEMAVKLGFKKIVVAPYFLFSGRLMGRIYAYVDRIAAAHPDISFLKCDYLRDHPAVISTFADRIGELIGDATRPPTLMDDFKARLAHGEVTIHHHHAEFKPHDETEDDTHHHHEHHHAPYQHIGHPYGPRTMIDENVCCCFMGQFPPHIIDEERQRKKEPAPDLPVNLTPLCRQ